VVAPGIGFSRVVVPAVAGLAGLVLGVAAIRQRRPVRDAYADLAGPYGIMALVFGSCGVMYAGLRLADILGTPFAIQLASPAMSVVLFVILVPWTVFTLRYAGRGRLVTRRRVVVASALIVLLLGIEVSVAFDLIGLTEQQRRSVGVFTSILSLAVLTVVFAGTWLVLSTTSRHDRLTQRDGLVAVLPIAIPLLVFQITRPSTPVVNELLTVVGFGAIAVVMWLGATRHNLLHDRPGTGTLGERVAVSEMDEVVFVIDRAGRLAQVNAAATATFGPTGEATDLRDVVGHDIDMLTERATVECRTVDGLRQFDPRVTDLRNSHGELLGYTVTLFDVTDREIRQQRLQVLNRILRHNLRNRLDVIRAHAEEAANADIIENADQLDRLSSEARRIETLMQRAGTTQTSTHLPTVVDEVVEAVTEQYPAVETNVDVPDVTLEIDRGLCRYALEQLVENAVEHNDTEQPRVVVNGAVTATGPRITVADNGPGIPAAEREVITAGTEHDLAHGRSLGLWGTNWAVQTLGGALSFEASELGGAAVVVDLPDAR
jgi:signal transduction histidine kinase